MHDYYAWKAPVTCLGSSSPIWCVVLSAHSWEDLGRKEPCAIRYRNSASKQEIRPSRQRSAASSTHPPYRQAFEKSVGLTEQAEMNGASPETIARRLEQIMNNPKPKLRYPVGPLLERLGVALKPVLPYRLYERLAMSIFGLSE